MSLARSPTIKRVVEGHLCSGCGLCAAVSGGALVMAPAEPGYNRPKQRLPIDQAAESVIASVCPGVVVAPWPPAPNVHPVWGPWRRVVMGHASDEALRYRASSGGALSALLIHALAIGDVDRVIHITADPDNPTGNIVTCSTTAAEIAKGAGSRYSASSPLEGIDGALADGGSFAFVGKPCDVSALRLLGLKDQRVAAHARLVLSFLCAGIPSRRGADRILAAMGVSRGELARFRYRGHGWPGKAVATTRAGDVHEMSYEESWGRYLSPELQFRCKICPDSVGGVADIACGDAWYSDARGYPAFEERDGRSLILVRTTAGERLLQGAVDAGAILVEPLAIDAVDQMMPFQAERKRLVRSRLAALAATLQPTLRTHGTMVEEAAAGASVFAAFRSFAGAVRRILIRRR